MDKARELINAHLYPVLATFSVIYFGIQIAPIANQARSYNRCVEAMTAGLGRADGSSNYSFTRYNPESYCNGGVR
jgi:hypothetical protein